MSALLEPSARGNDVLRAGREGAKAMNAYLSDTIKQRRQVNTDDLISALVTSNGANDEMSEEDMIASFTQLMFAAKETTSNLMALTLVALAQHPDQRRRIVRDRSLIPAAIEEVNRWQTPVAARTRHARGTAAEIAGVPIPDGDAVTMLPIAANRDPSRWVDPARFDIDRSPVSHLGFGIGRHVCLGQNLARLEIQVLMDRLLDEIPEWDVIDVDYGANFWVRGPKSLVVAKAS
jgi:cytochrome P450